MKIRKRYGEKKSKRNVEAEHKEDRGRIQRRKFLSGMTTTTALCTTPLHLAVKRLPYVPLNLSRTLLPSVFGNTRPVSPFPASPPTNPTSFEHPRVYQRTRIPEVKFLWSVQPASLSHWSARTKHQPRSHWPHNLETHPNTLAATPLDSRHCSCLSLPPK